MQLLKHSVKVKNIEKLSEVFRKLDFLRQHLINIDPYVSEMIVTLCGLKRMIYSKELIKKSLLSN